MGKKRKKEKAAQETNILGWSFTRLVESRSQNENEKKKSCGFIAVLFYFVAHFLHSGV